MHIALGYFLSVFYAAFCIGLGELARKCGVLSTYSRKIVHISVGFEWFILRYYMGTTWHFLAVCLLFLILLYTAAKKHWFSGMSSDNDNAPGTVYYALAMSVMAALTLFVPDFLMPFGIAVICTSLGDGLAGVFGVLMKKNAVLLYGKKTLLGTVVCFAASFFGVMLFARYFSLPLTLPMIYFIALLSASTELISKRGLDNLSVALVSCLFSYGWLNYPAYMTHYLFPILLTPWIIVLAERKRALTKDGIYAALFLDAVLTVALGNAGFFLLLFFLLFGWLCDAVKKRSRYGAFVMKKEEKSGARDAWQVLANGGVFALLCVFYVLFDHPIFLYGALASIAEALGDTAASSFGVFAKKTFDPFRLRTCEMGQSGGMSVIGTAAALTFCALSLGASWFYFEFSLSAFFIMLGAAFFGTVFDSFLGSRLQVKYRCILCESITEKKKHCGRETVYESGVLFINNDFVNASSTLMSAVLCIVFFLIK